MPLTFVFAVALVIVATLVVALVITTWNTVVALRKRSERAWANVDVALKQRHDELPAVVAAVRGQLGFEQQVLEEVTRLRAAYQPQAPLPDQAATSDATSRALRSLFAVVERYPDLRSNQNVMALQEEIERLETLIARRRELYNEQVYQHNVTITQVPAVFLAGIFGWRPLPSFAAEAPERARPEVGILPG
jgi:LemA protein